MKIPEPIMPPITIMVASNKLSRATSWRGEFIVCESERVCGVTLSLEFLY